MGQEFCSLCEWVFAFIHALRFIRRTLHLFIRCTHWHAALIHALHWFLRSTRSHTTLVYALQLFISCINSYAASCLVICLSLYQLQGLILPDQFLLLSGIAYTASYLLACIFSLPFIKPNIQLLIEETQADGYKAPSFPHSYSLFSLVHIAWIHIFISLYFSQ